MISNSEFQSVYLFSKDYVGLAERVENVLPMWNSCHSQELFSRIVVGRPFDIKFKNELWKFQEGDRFLKVYVYGRPQPWPEELALTKWIFQEEVPGVHFIPSKFLEDYFISGFIDELEIVLEVDSVTLEPAGVQLNDNGQSNRLYLKVVK